MLRLIAKICLPALLLVGCVVPLPPVEVTRQDMGIDRSGLKVFLLESGSGDSQGSFGRAVSAAMGRAGFVAAGVLGANFRVKVEVARPQFDATGFGELRLNVRMVDLTAREMWMGTAKMRVRQNSPAATSELAAKKLADALFSGFPGESGKTITVP